MIYSRCRFGFRILECIVSNCSEPSGSWECCSVTGEREKGFGKDSDEMAMTAAVAKSVSSLSRLRDFPHSNSVSQTVERALCML